MLIFFIFTFKNVLFCFLIIVYDYVCLSEYGYMQSFAQVWKSEDNLWEAALHFHYVGLKDWTQVVMHNSRSLYQLIQVTDPRWWF